MAIVSAGVALVACSQTRDLDRPGADAPPPVAQSSPAEDAERESDGPVADNSRCHVCHINFEDEELAVTHAEADIGCEECHGDSTPHCEDEDNVTPPDIMFAKADINKACMECHTELPKTETDSHEDLLAGKSDEKYCTECHGEHQVAHRTRQWDKRTGKLITSDGVRMTETAPTKE